MKPCFTRILDAGLYLFVFLLGAARLSAQCGDPSWMLSNDCGDIQASGGLAAGQPTIFCEGETVIVENNSSPAAQINFTYIDWGDGFCQQLNGCPASMTHVYDFPNDTCISASSGQITFNVRLGVKLTCGAAESFNYNTFPIAVKFKPVANFSVNPQALCVNDETDFNNTSCANSNNPMYLWNMGNGTTFTTEDVNNYQYNTAGTYTVTMTVTNSCGTDMATHIIAVTPPATAMGTVSDNEICAGETVTFGDVSTNANGRIWMIMPSSGVQFVAPTNNTHANPIIRFNNPGTYTVTLKPNGCGSPQWTTTITVLTPASISSWVNIDDDCAMQGTPFVINPGAMFSGSNTTISWSFPGGTPATFTGADPGQVEYPPVNGQYIITATISNVCNTAGISDTFLLSPPATAGFNLSDTHICGPDSILILTNTSTNSNNSYTWTITPNSGFVFVNGTGTSSPNPQIRFTQEGTYSIQLRVNACGDPIATQTVEVRLSPVINPNTVIPDGCSSVNVSPASLIMLSGGAPDSIIWAFEGGNIASFNGPNPPDVLFDQVGMHSWSVVAGNECGVVSIIDSFQIFPYETVSLSPVTAMCSGDAPLMLQAMPGNGVWSGPGVTPSGIFTPANAVLNTQNQIVYRLNPGSDCEVSDTLFILVQGTVVNATSIGVCANAPALGLSASPAGGVWSGDNVSPGGQFDPATAMPGSNEVVYTYTDQASGCVNRDTAVVSILSPPSALLDSIGRTCVGEPLDFAPFSGGTSGNSCTWDFGDGATSAICDPVHTYQNPGVYSITLQVGNNAGCKDTVMTEIQVVTPPNAVFTTDTTSGCADLPVLITNQSAINDYTLYIWEYGDGRTDTLQQPGTIVYFQGEFDTTYTIRLIAVNGCGNAEAQIPVTVFPRPQVRFGTDVSNGCTPLEVNFNNVSVGNPDFYRWYVNGQLVDTAFQLDQQVFLTTDHDSIYVIALVAGNECGLDTVTHTVLVKPNPVVAFFNTDTLVGCQPFSIQLIDYSTQGLYLSWDLGDGTTAVGDTVWHTFSQSGQYTVQLFANNGCGFDTTSNEIVVLPLPEVSFTHEPYACLGDTMFFTNTSPLVIGSYWDFGDGTSDSTQTSTFHIYASPGNYTVEMTGLAVTTGCANTATSTVEIKSLPQPEVLVPDSFGCQPFLFQPINTTPGNINFYVWDFGDGTTSIGANGGHLYPQAGQYEVSLQVTDFYECKNEWTFNPIQVFPKPAAGFEVAQTDLCTTPTTLDFTNTSVDADAYQWFFENHGTSTAVNPTLNIADPGEITTTLYAQNQFGCRDTVVESVTVYSSPFVDFTIQNQIGCEPYLAVFDNLSTAVNQFDWHFGDGETSNEENPIHWYDSAGVYTVTLYASADSVCFDSITFEQFVTVLSSPVSMFTYAELNDTIVSPNGIFIFNDASLNAIRWRWSFGDGDTADVRNPVHRYISNGPYTVSLITWNELGCSDTSEIIITPAFFGGLYIPNAFSPEAGGEGENAFRPIGVGLQEYHIAVYALNGQKVWDSDALDAGGSPTEAWNGKLNNKGRLLDQGVYTWRAFARFGNGRIWPGMSYEGKPPVTEGKVLLIR